NGQRGLFSSKKRDKFLRLSRFSLFCIINSTIFADNIDLDLSWIFQFSFDLVDDVAGNNCHLIVSNHFWTNHNANFTSSLYSKTFFNALKGVCNFLQLFQTLDIVFQVFTSCTRSCSADSICRLNDAGNQGFWLYVTMMSFDCMDDGRAFFIFSGKIYTDLDMASFDFVGQCFSDIMN